MAGGRLTTSQGGHVDFVAFGVGQRPPIRRVVVADQVAASGDRSRDPRFGLIVRDGDVDVDAVALRARRVHLLEPERRPAAVGIVKVFAAHGSVSEHCAPERHDVGSDKCVDRDLDVLHGGRVNRKATFACQGRDRPRELDVAQAEPLRVMCPQSHSHARVPQVDIRVVIGGVGHPADRVHKLDTFSERPGAKVRARPAEQHPPVFDAGGLVELPRRYPLGHGLQGNVPSRRTSPREHEDVPRRIVRMDLTTEDEPVPSTSESYPNKSGKRELTNRSRVAEEVEGPLVHDSLSGDERHARAVPSHRSSR